MYTLFIAAAGFAALGTSVPTQTAKRATTECGQYDSVTTGSYTVYNDLWGEDDATSGSQCFTLDSVSGDDISWSTSWTWEGGTAIKSFANVVVSFTSTELNGISSIATTWDWSNTGTDVLADVAYDSFTSSTAGGSNEFEVMVWLASIGGAGPISSAYSADGSATAIATATIGGYSWSLYKGPNGDTTVYSFLPASEITSFSGDLMDFFNYLIDDEGFDSTQYLTSVGAGTEATTGEDVVFTVSKYSAVVATS